MDGYIQFSDRPEAEYLNFSAGVPGGKSTHSLPRKSAYQEIIVWQIPWTRSKKGSEKYVQKDQTKQQLPDLLLSLTNVETIHIDWDDMDKITLQYATAVQHGLCHVDVENCQFIGDYLLYRKNTSMFAYMRVSHIEHIYVHLL